MMTILFKFPVPGEPPSINEMPMSRGGKMGWNRKRKSWAETVDAYLPDYPELLAGLGPSNVHFDIGFENHRTRDPHNYTPTIVKWCIDAMVKGGVWPDDNPKYVTVIDPTLTVGSNHIIVTITPREDAA